MMAALSANTPDDALAPAGFRPAAGASRLHVAQIADGLGSEAAGTSVMIRHLSAALGRHGHDIEILTIGAQTDAGPDELAGDVRMRAFRPDLAALSGIGRLRPSRGLASAIDDAARAGTVLHSHGLWRMANVYPGLAAQRHKAPLVLSPHGMLSPAALGFSRRQKALFGALAQKRTLTQVKCFHATSQEELAEIRAFGCRQPVAVIPNGIDVPPDAPEPKRGGEGRTVLYLGRLHPIKALDTLLGAWAHIESQYPSWRLRLVGPSEGSHECELRALAGRLGVARVSFEPGLYGDAKQAAYRSADLFVLPSRSENFGVVVAEALACATPVIASRGTPWQGLVEHRCGWWADHGTDAMAAALSEAMSAGPDALTAMGQRGRAWMERDFSWATIALSMAGVYRWCQSGGEYPECVTVKP